MELSVRHHTFCHYGAPARVALLLRLQPATLDGQQPVDWKVTVDGEPVPVFSANAYGDGEAFFRPRGPVTSLEIVAAGTVETRDRQGIVSGFGQDPPPALFLRQTALTRPDRAIAALAGSVRGDDGIGRLHALSARVGEAVAYQPGATSSASTAAEALALGRGVCQDHAHLFVSAARLLGVPARYAVGYLLAGDSALAELETHGWAEAWVSGLGWVGFDPTNGICVTERYVRLCCGLDASDAAPVRGFVLGPGATAISAEVRVTRTGPGAGQQGQQQ